MQTEKIYFTYKEVDGDYFWVGPRGEKLHFSGYPKFIVQGLINKFGPEKGRQVFEDFMEGVKAINEIEFKKKGSSAATFVLYAKKERDVNKEQGFSIDEEIYDPEEEYPADGESVRKKNFRSFH